MGQNMKRPRLTNDQIAEWRRYAEEDEEQEAMFQAPPGALIVLLDEVLAARGEDDS